MKLAQLKILLVLFPLYLHAQEKNTDEFTVDRPDVTESPYTVKPLCFQLENGIDLLHEASGQALQIPNMMLRTGISKSTEFRIAYQHGIRRDRQNFTGQNDWLLAGIKQRITHHNKALPDMAIIGHYGYEIGAFDKIKAHEYEVLLAFQNNIDKKNSIGYNLGFEKSNSPVPYYFLSSVSWGHQLAAKTSFFAEYYNSINRLNKTHAFDAGLAFLAGKKLMLDVLAGFNVHSVFFFSAGFSFRIDNPFY